MTSLIIAVLLVALSHVSVASTVKASVARQQASQVLTEIKSWDNIRIKQILKFRMNENQFMLEFISEHHEQLAKTEIDSSYQYAVESLLRDQSALIYISQIISDIDKREKLELDKYLDDHVAFSKEVEQALSHNLMASSGKALVDRVLYYSLINKYPAL